MTDRRDLETWRMFLRVNATITEALDRELRASCGLPLTWYDVLVTLSEAPGERLRMQDLASAVLFSRSGLTRLVDRLEERGLVERETDVADRRGSFAVLTREGRHALRRAATVHVHGIERWFTAALQPSEAEAFRSALTRLTEQDVDV